MSDPRRMDRRDSVSRNIDDELFALLGIRLARPPEEPPSSAASSPSSATFEEFLADLLKTHPPTGALAETVLVPPNPGTTPGYEEFARLFGARAHEALGRGIEPIDAELDESPVIHPHMLGPSSAHEAAREDAVLAPPAASSPPAPPPWMRALQIGSITVAGILVVLGVLSIRRRFAELRRLGAAEAARVRGELKAEIAQLQNYVRGDPNAASAADHLERTERELDDLFAEIDRRHQVSG